MVVGGIHVENAGFPWLDGRFIERPGLAGMRPLLERELALVELIDDAYQECEIAYDVAAHWQGQSVVRLMGEPR
ncbi:hypothetical protein [Streptomyces sp. NPDC001530]|uniref:hypothetical protein n=1 Tax=Streptomyces sp. NPDC001530 TaxID=3364582 RepID=UPI0036A19537